VINVLGIDVTDDLLARWREWFAPEVQPFPSDGCELGDLGRTVDPTPEVRDTFYLYSGERVWLDESEFSGLPLAVRRVLLRDREATGRLASLPEPTRRLVGDARTDTRVVWWPRLLQLVGDQPVIEYVEEGVRPSRHRELSAETWRRTEPVLPGAADLAGTFPPGSGPNCFGTVMAAAGIPGAESEWMFQEPFEEWLAEQAEPIRGTGRGHRPGVVLVWRDTDGLAVHAAVTIGDGYALSKPSQSWCSPRVVWTVRETIMAARHAGATVSRYVINPARHASRLRRFGKRGTDLKPSGRPERERVDLRGALKVHTLAFCGCRPLAGPARRAG